MDQDGTTDTANARPLTFQMITTKAKTWIWIHTMSARNAFVLSASREIRHWPCSVAGMLDYVRTCAELLNQVCDVTPALHKKASSFRSCVQRLCPNRSSAFCNLKQWEDGARSCCVKDRFVWGCYWPVETIPHLSIQIATPRRPRHKPPLEVYRKMCTSPPVHENIARTSPRTPFFTAIVNRYDI